MPRVESPPLPVPSLRLRRPLCFFPRRRQAIRAHWLVLNPECWVSPAAASGLHVCPSPSAGSSARGATAMDVASLVDRDGGKEGEGGSENENIAEKRRKGRTAADREEDKRRQCRATGSALSLGSRGIASDLLGRPRCRAAVVRSVRDTRFADDVSPVSPYPLLGEGERERTSIEGTDRDEEEEKSGQRECRCPMLWAGKRGREAGRDAGCESERGQPRLRAALPPRSNEVHRFCCRFHTRPRHEEHLLEQ